MKIEHFGICVKDPFEVADWYCRYLGLSVAFRKGSPDCGAVFLSDESGKCVVEMLSLPSTKPLAEEISSPMQCHLAFISNDPEQDSEKLISGGCSILEAKQNLPGGEKVFLLKDPFGNFIQLIKRAQGIEIIK